MPIIDGKPLITAAAILISLIPHAVFGAASPGITTQPQSQSVIVGSNAVFTVAASGNTPLFYQWSLNGTNLTDSVHIDGATNTTLTVSNVVVDDAGNYQCTVTNTHGSATSSNATLTVLVPAAIVVPPTNQSVVLSNNASFAVTATGTAPLNYQWYFNGVALTDGGRVSGSVTTNLSIANVQTNDGGSYQLVVTNNYGSTTSAVVGLTVLVPAAITVQPTNQSVILSNSANFTVTATGTAPLNYQWYFNGSALTDGGRVSGSMTTSLSIANVQTNDGGSYQLVVTNDYGSATSAVATLTVLVPAAITVQPTNQSVVLSNNASFIVTAIGTAPLSCQWYFNGSAMADGNGINGSTTTNLSLSNIQTNEAGAYQLVVTNDYGSATSAVATLTVLVPAAITTQPINTTVLVSGTATFAINAIGTTNLYYQWYFNGTPLADGGGVSGSTSATLTIANAQTNNAGSYQAVVVNYFGSDTSAVANLTVWFPAQITNQPASEAVLLGSNAMFSAAATGSAINYQWFFDGTPLADSGRISGSATPTLTISDVQSSDAGGYVLQASNLLSSATSRMASLTPLTSLSSSIRYVNLSNATPSSPFLTWSTAATNIQDAVDAAVAGDSVVVTNGVYQSGGRVMFGAMANQVAIDKAITVQSVNGPAVTIIAGIYIPTLSHPIGGRCAYLTNNAFLGGFTLTTGGTLTTGDIVREQSGGGVSCESSSATVSNCVIANNYANYYGGGAFRGTLFNCILTNNTVNRGSGGGACSNALFNCTLVQNSVGKFFSGDGGGAFYCTLSNCLVINNFGITGGGIYGGTVIACIISSNSAIYGGGVCLGVANNSLISSNSANSYGGGAYSNVLNNCILQNNSGGGAFSCTLNNCTITNNRSSGAYSSILNNCIIKNNSSGYWSGGASHCTLNNCLLAGNTGMFAESADNSTLKNCTITGLAGGYTNASYTTYATYECFLNNCIIYGNTDTNGQPFNWSIYGIMSNCCTTPLPPGNGNITNDPAFVNPAAGDFHLQSNSPCINSGNNAYVTVTNDLDGNPRIVGGTVDMGCYEYQSPSSVISYAWLQQYGLPTDGTADYANYNGTTFNVYQDWIAGLNPTDPTSVLAMSSAVSTNTSGITVTWQSVNTRIYYLQRSTNLAAQPTFSSIQSNIIGQAETTSYTDSSATNSVPYFYRIGVQ